MEAAENFSLKWNDFEDNISSGLKDLRNEKHFFDVTLLSETGQVGAHKLILSACSTFFRQILVSNPHQHPLIYLKGISKDEVINILNFMYCGQVNVAQEELSSFLAAAEDLKVKGLTNMETGDKIKNVKTPRKYSENAFHMQKLKNLSPISQNTPLTENSPMLELVQVKSEPVSLVTGEIESEAQTSRPLSAKDYNNDDFAYDEYQNQDSCFEDEFNNKNVASIGKSDGPNFYPFIGDRYPLLPGHVQRSGDQASLRKRRQQILQFINQNKGRMDDSYLCLICNKSVTDNSNMNKHLEFKHGDELKEFLSTLV